MTLTTDQLESVRIVLGIGLVLSNIAVWYGVWLERDSAPQEIKDRGWRLLVRSLAAEAALAFLLLAADTTLGVRQRAEILTLETKIAPRRLSIEQQGRITADLFGWSEVVRIESYSLDGESAVFASQIGEALSKTSLRLDDGRMSQSSLSAINFGVHVTGKDNALVKALLNALHDGGIAADSTPPIKGAGMVAGSTISQDGVAATIFVGIKPLAQ
jgi:hypothetical protein